MRKFIEWFILLALLMVVLLRPVVTEVYDSSTSSFSLALGDIDDPTPLRTIIFDLVILSAVTILLALRLIRPSLPWRWTGLEWGYALLCVAGVISCYFAGQQRLAITATVDWLCLPLVAIAFAQLLTNSLRRRIVLAVILTGSALQAFQCFEQFTSFDDTWNQYTQMKQEFWAKQGVNLDSNKVELFERRIQGRETSGYFPHPNVAASSLMLCLFTALGLAMACWKGRGYGIAPGRGVGVTLIAIFIFVALTLSNSLGAGIATFVGLVLWMLSFVYRSWIDHNRKKALHLGCLAVVLAASATLGHGLYHDKLPGWSLTFRWQYWKTSASMIADHPLTGVGRENFGRHYLEYKPIVSPEEVSNPHNLFVQAATDWGLLGVVGLILMLYGASRVLATSTKVQDEQGGIVSAHGPPGLDSWAGSNPPAPAINPLCYVLVGLLTVAVVTFVRRPLLGSDDPNFIYYAMVTAGGLSAIVFALIVWGFHPFGQHRSFENIIMQSIAVGLFAFLLHDTINFALFVPGAAITFFALLGVVLSRCDTGSTYSAQSTNMISMTQMIRIIRGAPLVSSCLALAFVIFYGLLPVVRSQEALTGAQALTHIIQSGSISEQPAYPLFQQAIKADPLDPSPPQRYAQWLMSLMSTPTLSEQAWDEIPTAIDQTIQRDPQQISHRRTQMRFYRWRATNLESRDDFQKAIDAAQEVLTLYPQSPPDLAALADRELEAAIAFMKNTIPTEDQSTVATTLLDSAIQHFQAALDLDNQRIQWEKLHRMSEQEIDRLQQHLDFARKLRATDQ